MGFNAFKNWPWIESFSLEYRVDNIIVSLTTCLVLQTCNNDVTITRVFGIT